MNVNKKGIQMNAIALRFSEKFAPSEGTIQAHLDVLNVYGYVWYGKIGKMIGDKAINSLLSIEHPKLLLINSGKTERYWAEISEVKKEIPENAYPEYYKSNIDNFKVWFKIVNIRKAKSDILAHCTVSSSGEVLSIASKRSMSSFFIINVKEEFV